MWLRFRTTEDKMARRKNRIPPVPPIVDGLAAPEMQVNSSLFAENSDSIRFGPYRLESRHRTDIARKDSLESLRLKHFLQHPASRLTFAQYEPADCRPIANGIQKTCLASPQSQPTLRF